MNVPMSVIRRRPDGQTEVAVIDLIRDVLYAEKNAAGKLVYHTHDAVYEAITEPEDLDEVVPPFHMLDMNNAVNTSKIKKLGRYLRLYFEPAPGKGSKFASISWFFMRFGHDLVDRWIKENTSGNDGQKAI